MEPKWGHVRFDKIAEGDAATVNAL